MSNQTQPWVDFSGAPMPTAGTLKTRKNVPLQFFRFMSFNIAMMKMVLQGHSQH